eukprot:865269-Pyramimonas_sp.AAC.1
MGRLARPVPDAPRATARGHKTAARLLHHGSSAGAARPPRAAPRPSASSGGVSATSPGRCASSGASAGPG